MKTTSILDRLRAAAELLEAISADGTLWEGVPAEDRERLLRSVARVYSPDRVERRRMAKAAERSRKAARVRQDEAVRSAVGIRTLRQRPLSHSPNVFPPKGVATTAELQHCYVCKEKYTQVHHFYDQLCPPCADVNFRKRTELADLRGRTALLTGGRVKIGYQAALKLLRSGADVIVTTRFPRDAASRYSREPDFGDWRTRLEIVGLDLRHTPSLEAFCTEMLATQSRLDFVINNACQTVKRPPAFYAHMLERETAALQELTEDAQQLIPACAGELASPDVLFPAGRLDADLQQVDLRERNSWRLLLAEVSTVELLEVQLVNAIAPFVLNARLKSLMTRVPGRDKHIVNVSAMEGQFYRRFKTTRHPHTNMAKAALNMMTRTSAADYVGDGIHMNSVDTGWVTDEDPAPIAARKQVEQRFSPPLDSVDGAARIVDPIISGFNTGTHLWGQFLKDYRPTDW